MALHSLLYPTPIWSEGISLEVMNNILKSIDLVLSYGDVNASTDDEVKIEKETAFGIVCRLYADGDISDYSPLFLPVLKKLVEAGADINAPIFLKRNRSEPAISLLPKKIQQELYSLIEYKQELNRQQKEDMEIYER